MAFPTTSSIDTFTRSNQTGIGGTGWVTLGTDTSHNIDANAAVPEPSTICGDFRTVPFSGDVEAWAVGVVFNIDELSSDECSVWCSYNYNAGAVTGLQCVVTDSATSGRVDVALFEWDTTPTQIGSTATQLRDSGDDNGIGIEVIGTTVTAYKRSTGAGAWTTVATGTASIPVDGSIGIKGYVEISTVAFTDFGGGAPGSAEEGEPGPELWVTSSGVRW